jgi:hypothetical protein
MVQKGLSNLHLILPIIQRCLQPPYRCLPTIQVNSTQPDSISSGPDWYLDSEVTHHVTNDINHLSSYISLWWYEFFKFDNGLGMKIRHIASYKLTLANCILALLDVLYIPSFTNNLLSISKHLNDNPILIEFHDGCCVIKERLTLMSLLWAMLHDELYTISLLLSLHALLL